MAQSRPDSKKMYRNLKLDVIVTDMVYFIFVCLLKLILYLRFKCVTETKNVSVLFYKNIKSSFLNDSHV